MNEPQSKDIHCPIHEMESVLHNESIVDTNKEYIIGNVE